MAPCAAGAASKGGRSDGASRPAPVATAAAARRLEQAAAISASAGLVMRVSAAGPIVGRSGGRRTGGARPRASPIDASSTPTAPPGIIAAAADADAERQRSSTRRQALAAPAMCIERRATEVGQTARLKRREQGLHSPARAARRPNRSRASAAVTITALVTVSASCGAPRPGTPAAGRRASAAARMSAASLSRPGGHATARRCSSSAERQRRRRAALEQQRQEQRRQAERDGAQSAGAA